MSDANVTRFHLEELFFSIVSRIATQKDYDYFFTCYSKTENSSLTSYINEIHSYLLSHIDEYFDDISFNKSFWMKLLKEYLFKAYRRLIQQGNLPSSVKPSTMLKMIKYYNSINTTIFSSFEITTLNILLVIQPKISSLGEPQTVFANIKPLLLTIFPNENALNKYLSLKIEEQFITETFNVNGIMNDELDILCGINIYLDIIKSFKGKDINKLFEEIIHFNSSLLSNHLNMNLLVEYIIEFFSYETIKDLIEKYISKQENTVNYYVAACYFINKMKDKINTSLLDSSSKKIDNKLINAININNNEKINIIFIPNVISIGLFYPSIGTYDYLLQIYEDYYISRYLSKFNINNNISLSNYYIILLHMIYHTQKKQNIIESTLTNNSYDVLFDLSKILSFSEQFINLDHSFPIKKYIPTFSEQVDKEGKKIQLTPQIHQTKSASEETISSIIDNINKTYASQNISVFHFDKKDETPCDDKEYLFIIKSFPENEKVIKMLTINNNNYVLVACYDNGKDIAYYLIENKKWYCSDKNNHISNISTLNVFTKNKNKNKLRLIYMKINTFSYYCYNTKNINPIKTYTNIQEVEMLVSLRYLVKHNSAFLNKWGSVYKDIISNIKYAKLIGQYILDKYKEDEDLNAFLIEHILPQLNDKEKTLHNKLVNKICDNKQHNK